MADAADSGGDWEVVSLTASAYAAAPGPISPLLLDAHNTESAPRPPAGAAAIFMSQHFYLPSGEPLTTEFLNRGRQEFTPAVAGGGDDCSESDSTSTGLSSTLGLESEGVMVADANANALLQLGGGGGELINLLTKEEPPQTTMLCSQSQSDATAGSAANATDDISVGSAAVVSLPLPAHAATAAVPSGGVSYSAAQAWWKKTFSFPRNNGTESLKFRFVFVAGKLQLQHLGPDEFGIHSQKINFAVAEPLGEVKVSMLGETGHPVAQQG